MIYVLISCIILLSFNIIFIPFKFIFTNVLLPVIITLFAKKFSNLVGICNELCLKLKCAKFFLIYIIDNTLCLIY